MRVFIAITKATPLGGAQRYVLDLAQKAKNEGHKVTVILGGKGELLERLESLNFEVITLPYLGRDINLVAEYKNFFALYHLFKEKRPDILHVNSSKMGGLGALAGKLAHVKKIIFTLHGLEFNAPRPELQKALIKFSYWFIFQLVDTVICVSKRLENDIKNWPNVKRKIVLIHNGIDTFPLLARDEARQKLLPDSKPETLIIGTLAELHKVKGLDLLLDAFGREFKNTDTKLVIVGTGDEESSLKALTKKLGLEAQVHFARLIKEARGILLAFDIFVIPSRSEGMPYVLLEAGVASRAVVATRVGGIPEVVFDSKSGFLVPPENPYFLSKALRDLADHPEKREAFGKALNEMVTHQFSKDSLLLRTVALYV